MGISLSPGAKHLIVSRARWGLEAAGRLLRWSRATRRAYRRAPRGACRILAYHQTPRCRAEAFRRQMEWLVAHRRVVSLSDLLQECAEGIGVESNSVAITFDDGFADNYEVAFPILQSLEISASFFVATDFIDLAGKGIDAVQEWGERVYRFAKVAEPMNWEQLRTLAGQGCEVGVHTKSHANLALLDKSEVRAEVLACRSRLENELGARPKLFAYPYGKREMAPPSVRKAVMDCGGFRAAFSTERGWNVSSTPREWLRRDSMDPTFSPRLLETFLSGVFDRKG